MTVDGYSFGEISIDGKPYTKDVIIWPDHVKCPWWRAEGHNLTADDLSEILGKMIKGVVDLEGGEMPAVVGQALITGQIFGIEWPLPMIV